MSSKFALAVIITGTLAVPAASATALSAPSQSTAAQKPVTQGAAAERGSADADFIRQAAEGGTKEVDAAKLAQSRASDSNVKVFADRMLKDHGRANEELMSLAKSKGVALPPAADRRSTTTDAGAKADPSAKGTAGARGTAGVEEPGGRLASLKGAEFDRAYMDQMVQDHEKTVQLFEQESKSGQDAEAKAWAAKQLPTLREHMTEAKTVRDRLAASK